MQRPAPTPAPISGRELLQSLATFVRTNGPYSDEPPVASYPRLEADLFKGKKKFSLNPPCLKFLNAKFREYKQGMRPSIVRLYAPLMQPRHSVSGRRRAGGATPQLCTEGNAFAGTSHEKRLGLTVTQLEPTHKNKLDGLTEIDLSPFSALTSLEVHLPRRSRAVIGRLLTHR